MLTKTDLLCKLIKDKNISDEQIRKVIQENNFDYSETKKIFEHILENLETKELIECFSDDFFRIYFTLLSEKEKLEVFYIRQITSPKLLEMLEDIIIKTGKPNYIYALAVYVKNINLKKIENALIKIANPEYLYNFAYNFPTADISKIEDAIINSKEGECIFYFARDIEKANIDKLENAIIDYGYPKDIYEFALYIPRSNKKKLEDAIINQKAVSYIYQFAKYIPGANIERLEQAVIESKNVEYIYNFAFHIETANVEKLEQAIIDSNNPKYIYYFAKCIKGANIKKLENAILNTDDIENILNFSKYVKYANSQKLRDKVAKLNEKQMKEQQDLADLQKKYLVLYQKHLQNNRRVKIIDFVKKYFNLELEIKEARKMIEDNLIEIINDIGLVSLYYQVSNPDFPVRIMVMQKLKESYPENQEILQVYYNFLTGYTSNFLETINLDKEYLELKQSDNSHKVKVLDK